jgi:hypothetical protein
VLCKNFGSFPSFETAFLVLPEVLSSQVTMSSLSARLPILLSAFIQNLRLVVTPPGATVNAVAF